VLAHTKNHTFYIYFRKFSNSSLVLRDGQLKIIVCDIPAKMILSMFDVAAEKCFSTVTHTEMSMSRGPKSDLPTGWNILNSCSFVCLKWKIWSRISNCHLFYHELVLMVLFYTERK
jgi:hypothetical protein